jgi:hypothetical protein
MAAAVVLGGPTARAKTLFTETFANAQPDPSGIPYGVGVLAGTKFTITQGTIDIVGVLNGNYFTCSYNPAGNCLDLVGDSPGTISSTAALKLKPGTQYTVQFGATAQGVTENIEFNVTLGSQTQTLTATPTPQTLRASFLAGAADRVATLTFSSVTNLDGYHGAVLSDIVVCTTKVTAKKPRCKKP